MANIEKIGDPITLLHMHFSSDPIAVGDVTMSISAAIDQLNLPNNSLENIEIVVTEVINNISEHAYQGSADGFIEVVVAHTNASISFHFIDSGLEMPGRKLPQGSAQKIDCAPEDLPEGGFGWFLIHTLGHALSYYRKNNENHLKFQIMFAPTS